MSLDQYNCRRSRTLSMSARLRVFIGVVFASCAISLLTYHSVAARGAQQQVDFTFAERVAYQTAIEQVYWEHRIWPTENPQPKPALTQMIDQREIEAKVQDYLKKSRALQEVWNRPATAGEIQQEIDRMSRDTQRPEMLRKLYEALKDDGAVIAECLARPILVERLIRKQFSEDERLNQSGGIDFDQWWTSRKDSISDQIEVPQFHYALNEINAASVSCSDDTWSPTSTATNVPFAREKHTAVWTGAEMIVWGGSPDGGSVTNTGGRYDPATDTWLPTDSGAAPTARIGHTAIWTGLRMIIWGGTTGPGFVISSGKLYNPATDLWATVTTFNNPSARAYHTAVWTGTQMIIWGGQNTAPAPTFFNNGNKFDPAINSWMAVSNTNAPATRSRHTAVWTGSKMVVWGGLNDSGPLDSGGRYDPVANDWAPTNPGAIPARFDHTAVWTGSLMVVFGGQNGPMFLNSGGRYNPMTDLWFPNNQIDAPTGRSRHTAVWTGNEVIVWGGTTDGTTNVNTGGRYNVVLDRWIAPTSTAGAPTARSSHTAVWTGNQMIVWGGCCFFSTGGRYCVVTSKPDKTSDFDADRRTDLAVWRPSNGEWFILNSLSFSIRMEFLGSSGDVIVPQDYDGDGKTDLAVWKTGTGEWVIRNSSDNSMRSVFWGVTGDIPNPGDYDGDGKADIAVWRPSTGQWFIIKSSDSSTSIVYWGVNGDKPVLGDFDGDGKADLAVWRPSTGVWFIINSSNSSTTVVSWGVSGDRTVIGDYDKDGRSDVAVWRPSTGTWFIIQSSNGSMVTVGWGLSTDVAVPGDYDGDGKTDEAVWRPSEGNWYILNSNNSSVRIQMWGVSGDQPVPAAYVR